MSDQPTRENSQAGSSAQENEQGAQGAGAQSDTEQLRAQLAEKTKEAAESYDRLLRERAELENFKRRMKREKAEALRFASESLVRELLPVLDNLERAITHAEAGGNGQPLVEGVRLVLKSTLDVLERHGVSRIEAAGQSFDPNVHEAIAQIVDTQREPNQVVEQLLPGYLLHDRLLRPAQVTVSGKPAVEKGPGDD